MKKNDCRGAMWAVLFLALLLLPVSIGGLIYMIAVLS